MYIKNQVLKLASFSFLLSTTPIFAENIALPDNIQKVMRQDKYRYSSWGLFVKDSVTNEILLDYQSDKMFLPASTTKLFTMAALLNVYGPDYRFKTPVYTDGKIDNGVLKGNLILVAKGDLTFGGRQPNGQDSIAFTKLDHTIANVVPGVILAKGDPLFALKNLAKQIKEKGINKIEGSVLIDDRLFEISRKRAMVLSPIIINENLIDFVINAGAKNQKAFIQTIPQVTGYAITNNVKTVGIDEALKIDITSDEQGKNILIAGTIPKGSKDLVRTFSIKDPAEFAKAAFIEVLKKEGILIDSQNAMDTVLPAKDAMKNIEPIAVWTSPTLSETVKLILKVSHNLGADLAPLLIAVKNGKTTFDDGMLEIGKFLQDKVGLHSNEFVFADGAGGDENRVTPQAEIHLLEYMKTQDPKVFKTYYDALPILGVDGSLADFGLKTDAIGKARAKTGTGMTFNSATGKLFLTTQALTGYIEAKNEHLLEYMVVVNNAQTPQVEDVLGVFEDEAEITGMIYDLVK